MYIQNIYTLLAQAAIDIAVAGPYHGAKIALFTNNQNPSRSDVLSSYTVADFGGLTNEQSITWGTPFLNGNQQAEVLGGLMSWLTTSTTGLPVTAYGYVIVDTTGAILLLAEKFATPVTFGASGNSFSLIPRLVYAN